MRGGLPDPDWTALQIRLKPAVRMKMPREAGRAMMRKLEAQGLSVASNDEPTRGDLLIYVARAPGYADELRRTEALTFATPGVDEQLRKHERLEAHRRMGALLGYPPCCVEAFVRRAAAVDGPDGARDDEDWLAASAALHDTRGTPDARLNPLLWPARVLLISFYPCRYDCAAALAWADTLYAALAARAPGPAAELLRALAVKVAITPDGRRAVIDGDRMTPMSDRPLPAAGDPRLVVVGFERA